MVPELPQFRNHKYVPPTTRDFPPWRWHTFILLEKWRENRAKSKSGCKFFFSHAKNQKFLRVSKKFYSWTIEVKNSVKDKNCWFYYSKMFWKFQILKKALKQAKTFKQRKKNLIFLFWRLYTERKNCLFYAKFFDWSQNLGTFFWLTSSLSILWQW